MSNWNVNDRSLFMNWATRQSARLNTRAGLPVGTKSNSSAVRFGPEGMVVSDMKALEMGRMNWKKAEDMLFLFL